ncbi:MAG: sigma-54-dependent Fis family transcriptional regulator [Gammaproteobacteria bacterium]|nr:MAG: sigma-54-dependent Fis family transcriptional regulator [Gammaproteobacteria bacterium]
MARLLIIEDDPALAEMLALHFEEQGLDIETALDCDAGLRACRGARPDLVLLDQQLPDGAGIELLPQLLQCDNEPAVIMMTGKHDLELAIEAIKLGAADFIHKPIDTDLLQAAADKALARRESRGEPCPPPHLPERDLIGRSAAMLEVSKQIALAAGSDANVLVHGESGTGKEVVARLIHQHSHRPGPFVPLNCAAIVDTLLESELFGHEKGAFTGAERQKKGKFELAEGGTLFLDEIGEMTPGLQAKLLRALQERVIERVGGSEQIAVDVRIIAATHQDLFALAEAGRFREDLAYRLDVIHIELPPLRERREDIPLLAQALLGRIAVRAGACPPPLSSEVLDRLQGYDWPGNVRELENTLTQALVRARNGAILPEHLALGTHGTGHPPPEVAAAPPLQSLDQVEAEYIQRVLDYTGGHKGRSCDILGISRPALDRKIRKYGLRLPDRNTSRRYD